MYRPGMASATLDAMSSGRGSMGFASAQDTERHRTKDFMAKECAWPGLGLAAQQQKASQ